MRTARPTLVLSEAPSYSTPFFHDPWPLEGCSPHSDDTSSGEYRFSGDSNRSSRTSSSHSHVLPESAFLNSNNDGTYIVDPWFGQKDLALLCSKYLNRAFNSVEETESSKRLGQPRLSIFIAQLMHITGVPLKVIGASLILLQRYFTIITTQQSHQTTHHCLSGHRLFIGALMLACSDDNLQSMSLGRENARSAAYWSDISLFPEHELDEVFNEMYDELDGNIVVFPSYAAALEKLNNPVSIKSFEGDLGAFVSADYDVDDSEAGVSESSLSLHEVDVSEKKKKKKQQQQQKKQRKNNLEASLRTRIVSLFTGRKSKS